MQMMKVQIINKKMNGCPSDLDYASLMIAFENEKYQWPEYMRIRELYKNNPDLIQNYVKRTAYRIFCTNDGLLQYLEESIQFMKTELTFSRQKAWTYLYNFVSALWTNRSNKEQTLELVSNVFDTFWPPTSPVETKIRPSVTPEDTFMFSRLYTTILSYLRGTPSVPTMPFASPSLFASPTAIPLATSFEGNLAGPMRTASPSAQVSNPTAALTASILKSKASKKSLIDACGFFEFQVDEKSCGRHALNHILGLSYFKRTGKEITPQDIQTISRLPSVNAVREAYPTMNLKYVCTAFDKIRPNVFFCEEEENYEARFLYYAGGLVGLRFVPPTYGTAHEISEPTYKLSKSIDITNFFRPSESHPVSPVVQAFDAIAAKYTGITKSKVKYVYDNYMVKYRAEKKRIEKLQREGRDVVFNENNIKAYLDVPDEEQANLFMTQMMAAPHEINLLLNYTGAHYTAAKSSGSKHCLYNSTNREGPESFDTREELLEYIIGDQFGRTGSLYRKTSIWVVTMAVRPYNVYEEIRRIGL